MQMREPSHAPFRHLGFGPLFSPTPLARRLSLADPFKHSLHAGVRPSKTDADGLRLLLNLSLGRSFLHFEQHFSPVASFSLTIQTPPSSFLVAELYPFHLCSSSSIPLLLHLQHDRVAGVEFEPDGGKKDVARGRIAASILQRRPAVFEFADTQNGELDGGLRVP